MPTRQRTSEIAVSLLKNAQYINGYRASEFGIGIYQVLLWYTHINAFDISSLPHIIDANQLKSKTGKLSAWQKRAIAFEEYLAQKLQCKPAEVQNFVDMLFKHNEFVGLQRQNPLGNAFIELIAHGIRDFGNQDISVETETNADLVFPGIIFPGRSKAASIDILVYKNNRPYAVVSVKWSIRHDRVNDLTNECPAYKAAAQRLDRTDLKYYVVTNEFDPARLSKVIEDSCIDNVIHIDKYVVTEICGLNGRLDELVSLNEFVTIF